MSAQFEQAYKDVGSLKTQPGNDEMLDLYGYAKIAKGEDITKSDAPGMFDLKGKAKRKRWQEFVDKGITKGEADKKYVDLVKELKEKYS